MEKRIMQKKMKKKKNIMTLFTWTFFVGWQLELTFGYNESLSLFLQIWTRKYVFLKSYLRLILHNPSVSKYASECTGSQILNLLNIILRACDEIWFGDTEQKMYSEVKSQRLIKSISIYTWPLNLLALYCHFNKKKWRRYLRAQISPLKWWRCVESYVR